MLTMGNLEIKRRKWWGSGPHLWDGSHVHTKGCLLGLISAGLAFSGPPCRPIKSCMDVSLSCSSITYYMPVMGGGEKTDSAICFEELRVQWCAIACLPLKTRLTSGSAQNEWMNEIQGELFYSLLKWSAQVYTIDWVGCEFPLDLSVRLREKNNIYNLLNSYYVSGPVIWAFT